MTNIGTEGDHLVKQFVSLLKGYAFDWYTNLKANFIDSWKKMERGFLNYFYSICCTVNIFELTNTGQQKYKLVIDYINKWRN